MNQRSLIFFALLAGTFAPKAFCSKSLNVLVEAKQARLQAEEARKAKEAQEQAFAQENSDDESRPLVSQEEFDAQLKLLTEAQERHQALREDKRAILGAAYGDSPSVSEEKRVSPHRASDEGQVRLPDPKYNKSAISDSSYNRSRSPQAAVSLQSSSAQSKPSAAAYDIPLPEAAIDLQRRELAEAQARLQDPKYNKSAISDSSYNRSRSPQAAVSLQSSSAQSKPSAAAYDSPLPEAAIDLQRRALAEAQDRLQDPKKSAVASASPVKRVSFQDQEQKVKSPPPAPPLPLGSQESLKAGSMLKGSPKASALTAESATASPQATKESVVSSAPTSDQKTKTQAQKDAETLCASKGDQEGCLRKLKQRFWG